MREDEALSTGNGTITLTSHEGHKGRQRAAQMLEYASLCERDLASGDAAHTFTALRFPERFPDSGLPAHLALPGTRAVVTNGKPLCLRLTRTTDVDARSQVSRSWRTFTMSVPLQDGVGLLRRLRPLSRTLAFSRPLAG